MNARLSEEELKQAVADYVKKHVGHVPGKGEITVERVTFQGLQNRRGRNMITAVTATATYTVKTDETPKPFPRSTRDPKPLA